MVVVCIGTPNICGDAVAPIAGDILVGLGVNAYIYGTTARPVTGANYREYYKHIKSVHSGETIIAIDSALGKSDDAGTVRIIKGGVKPGGALNKQNPKIGEYGILAQVGSVGSDAMSELLSAPYELVESLAKKSASIAVKLIKSIANNSLVLL